MTHLEKQLLKRSARAMNNIRKHIKCSPIDPEEKEKYEKDWWEVEHCLADIFKQLKITKREMYHDD